MQTALGQVEKSVGAKFGDPANPLLVSVRSGARASMPGMMDTVLNLGLNDKTVEGLAKLSGDARFAFDSYRRFIQMYSNVVLGIDHHHFEEILAHRKDDNGYSLDTDLTADDWKAVVAEYKAEVQTESGKPFPQDATEQLWGAIGAVFESWMNQRAITYRRLNNIPEEWGTAVNVQAMVFGNMGDDCATGVAFTRDPSTGENLFYGEYLVNAQGEDVVAGIRTPQHLTVAGKVAQKSPLPAMEEVMPGVFADLLKVRNILESHYKDMQDIEFTVQKGKLWMLQTRSGKRTAAAAVRVAVEMVQQGLIDKAEAVKRVEPQALDQLLHPTLDPKAKRDVLGRGLPASPGAASGAVVFSADEAELRAARGDKVILVRIETSPEDIHGMHAAQGIVTTRGGMTSHAAVVARGMGRACVAGAGDLHVDYKAQTLTRRRPRGQGGRHHHHRRLDRRGHARRRGDHPAGAVGRFRHADGMGRRLPPPAGARQCRNAARRAHRARLRRRGHRPVPHRAYVLRRRAHRRHARDDPGRRREGPPRRPGEDPADAARRFRRALHHHVGPAGHR